MSRFVRFQKMITEENWQRLQNSTVLVIGLGGVGGYVIEALARSGIGSFILVDYDRIDETNINRQIIALTSTIGRQKTEVWKERIKDINPDCQVVLYNMFYQENTKDTPFQEKVDYVIDACDTIASKKLIILECVKRKIPLISCMGTGNKLDPSQLYLADIRKTDYDPLARILRKWVKEEQIKEKILVLCSHEQPIKTNQRAPLSSAFVPSSAGLLIASCVIKDLLKE